MTELLWSMDISERSNHNGRNARGDAVELWNKGKFIALVYTVSGTSPDSTII